MQSLLGVISLGALLSCFGAACGGDALTGEGKPCNSSSECGSGLLCDFGKKPPVCATMDTVGRDLSMSKRDLSASGEDMAVEPPDLSGVDLFGVRDMSVLHDLTDTDGT